MSLPVRKETQDIEHNIEKESHIDSHKTKEFHYSIILEALLTNQRWEIVSPMRLNDDGYQP